MPRCIEVGLAHAEGHDVLRLCDNVEELPDPALRQLFYVLGDPLPHFSVLYQKCRSGNHRSGRRVGGSSCSISSLKFALSRREQVYRLQPALPRQNAWLLTKPLIRQQTFGSSLAGLPPLLRPKRLIHNPTCMIKEPRSAASTGCDASHSSLSIASSVPNNSAFAAKNETDATLLPRPASCDCPDRFVLVFANARMAIAYARARSPAYNAFTAPSVWRLFFCSLTLCSRRRLASASSFACRSKFASLAVKK